MSSALRTGGACVLASEVITTHWKARKAVGFWISVWLSSLFAVRKRRRVFLSRAVGTWMGSVLSTRFDSLRPTEVLYADKNPMSVKLCNPSRGLVRAQLLPWKQCRSSLGGTHAEDPWGLHTIQGLSSGFLESVRVPKTDEFAH